jgi:hypothetical protein
MVLIWLPADAHRSLLQAAPGWSRVHKVLSDATETHYAVGIRRVRCDLLDADALLQAAERIYPECAPLIRIAIRKARTASGVPVHVPSPSDRVLYEDPPVYARDRRSQLVRLRALASVQLLALSLQALPFVDRVREIFRRFL